MSDHGDLILARRMVAGQEEAFDEFFEEHFQRLMRFAMARMSHDGAAAEEVVQATLCLAITKLSGYRGEAALFTWLCTFCRHEIAAWYRRANRRQPQVELVEESAEVRAALESLGMAASQDPETALRRAEVARRVHVTLDSLPAKYARALEWKYVEGVPVAEIAARMGLSFKAAESLLTRAREAFKDGFSVMGAT